MSNDEPKQMKAPNDVLTGCGFGVMMFVLALLLGYSVAFAQEPVTGPITDAITERFEARFAKQSEEIKAMELRVTREYGDRIKDLMSQAVEARDERKTIIESFRDFNAERVGIVARIGEVREEIRAFGEKWTPIQNLVDRLTGLVWKLFIFVCVLGGLLILLLLLGLFLYSRLKGWVIAQLPKL